MTRGTLGLLWGKHMSDELKFFLLLIERYAYDHGRLTGDVLREWDSKGITQEIYDGYWQYHQESLQNAYSDIECLMATGKHLQASQGGF